MNPMCKVVEAVAGRKMFVWLTLLSVPVADLLCGIGFAMTHAKEFLFVDLMLDTILVFFVIAAYVGMQLKNVSAGYARFGFHGTGVRDSTLMLAYSFVGIGAALVMGFQRDVQFIHRLTANMHSNPWLLLVFVIPTFALAIYEEIIFRGYLLNWLANRSNRLIALVGSSLAFSIYHGNLANVGWFFSAGLVIGLVVQRTNALAPAVGLHAGFNLMVFWASGSMLPSFAPS